MIDFAIYIWDIICYGWPILLILGMIFIPVMWMIFTDIQEYESLDKYYNSFEDEESLEDKSKDGMFNQ